MSELIEDSPFAEEVVVREYAKQAGPVQDTVDYSPVEAARPGGDAASAEELLEEDTQDHPKDKDKQNQNSNTLSEDFIVEDDEDFLRFESLNEKAQAAYQEQDQEMDYRPPTEDADAEVLSSEIHRGVEQAGKNALSEQIYSGLAALVPETLHELSKVKDTPFLEQNWSEPITRTTLARVAEHNAKQRQKFAWGQLHESQIKHNLRAYLLEKGLENATSPAGMLLIGLITVAVVTFFTFKRVRSENRSMEQRLLSEIEQLIRNGEGRRNA